MTLAAGASQGSFSLGAFVAVLIPTALIAAFLLVVVYRDVEKRSGDGAKVAIALALFWPLGLYLWWKTRRNTARRGPVA